MTEEEKSGIVHEVIETIKGQSQDITELPLSDNIEDFTTLPAVGKDGRLKKFRVTDLRSEFASGSNIELVQETGQSEDKAMSQKATTAAIAAATTTDDGKNLQEVYDATKSLTRTGQPSATIDIAQELGEAADKPISQKAVSAVIAEIEKKARDNAEAIASMSASGGVPIAQEAGDSATKVMSQAAVKKAIENIKATTDDGKTLEDVYQIAKEDAIFGKEKVNDTIDVFNSGKYEITTANGWLGLNGNVASLGSNGWVYTDFISLKDVKKITYTQLANHPSVSSIVYYNSEKSFISKLQSISGEITSFPASAEYIRFCKQKDSNSIVTLYVDGERNVTVKEKLAAVSAVEDAVSMREFTTNITEFYNTSESGYVSKKGVLILGDANWKVSGLIPVFPKDTLSFSGFYSHSNITPIAFYTKDETFISGVAPQTQAGSIVVPNDAVYMRLSGSKGDKWVVSGKMRIEGEFVKELAKILGTGKYDYTGVLDITNSDAVIMEGSSYTEGVCQPVGFSWTEKLNDIIDLPVINDGISGSQRSAGILNIKSNSNLKSTPNISKANLPYSYVWFGNTANGSSLGIAGYNELLEAKATTESRGAEMLVGEEENPQTGNYEPLYEAFAQRENVKIANAVNIIGPMLYPGQSFAGQWYTSHKGWRAVSVYSAHYDFFEKLPIKQAIKAYKVRPTKNVNAVTDLFFKNIKERAKFFYAISSGQNGSSSSPKVTMVSCDNLDKVTPTNPTSEYDVQGTVETLSRESELAKLLSGGAVEFSKFALLEFVLNISKLGNAEISFACSVEPSKVYVAAMTEYLQHTATYNNGVVTINVADERCLRGDKISVLVECAGSFSISSPVCRYKGAQKKMRDFTFSRRKYGVEVLEDTSVQPFSGGTKFSLPSALNLYTKYNTVKSILKLTGEEKATRNFTISERANYAVRVVAQNFFKLMTTRFSGSEYNEFVNTDGISLQNYQYDKGEVVIMVDDLWTFPMVVESGWTELYIEVPLSTGSHKISIARANDVNVDTPIWLHDISVQKVW